MMALSKLLPPAVAILSIFAASNIVSCDDNHSSFFTEDMIVDSLDDVDTLLMSPQNNKKLEHALKDAATAQKHEIIKVVCLKHAPERIECIKNLRKFLHRCSQGDCFKLDDQPLADGNVHPAIKLPNKFQLDAVFSLYKYSDVFPITGFKDNLTMQFRKGGRYVAYKDFILQLLLANVTDISDASNLDKFMRKYFFMAAVYYKTYLMLDNWKARIQNLTKFSHVFFAGGIQESLTQIIANNIDKSIIGINPEEIKPYMKYFPEYIASFRTRMDGFAKAYTAIVVVALRSSITNIRHLQTSAVRLLAKPWVNLYKRVLKPVLKFMGKIIAYPFKFIWNAVNNLNSGEGTLIIDDYEADKTTHISNEDIDNIDESDNDEVNVSNDEHIVKEVERSDSEYTTVDDGEALESEDEAECTRNPSSPACKNRKIYPLRKAISHISSDLDDASLNSTEESTTEDEIDLNDELDALTEIKPIKRHSV